MAHAKWIAMYFVPSFSDECKYSNMLVILKCSTNMCHQSKGGNSRWNTKSNFFNTRSRGKRKINQISWLQANKVRVCRVSWRVYKKQVNSMHECHVYKHQIVKHCHLFYFIWTLLCGNTFVQYTIYYRCSIYNLLKAFNIQSTRGVQYTIY